MSAVPTPSPPASGIVDAHTHLLPPRLAAAIRRFFDAHLPGGLAFGIEPGPLREAMAAAGVVEVWTLPYAHTTGMAAGLNADTARLAAALSDDRLRVVPGCTVHPDDGDPVADVDQAVTVEGCRVLKLHCSVGGYRLDAASLQPVLARCGELGVPVVVHVGHDVSGRTTAEELQGLGAIADRHPTTAIIVAHSAHPATGAAVDLLDRHPNVYLDLTPVVTETVALCAGDLQRHAGRILLGSDCPNTALDYDALLGWLSRAELSPDAWAAITGGTARRLLSPV